MKPLSILRRGGSLGLAGAVLVGAGLVAVGLTAVPALADTSEPPLASTFNNSDPDIQHCSNQATGWFGLCIFTSSDLGKPKVDGKWWYPMDTTYLYTLDNGLDPSIPGNWVPRGDGTGAIFRESDIPWVADYPDGTPAEHLWAPTHIEWQNQHYLLVPDVEDPTEPGVNLTSRIAIATSPSLFSGYSYSKTYPIVGYASDPYVAVQPGPVPTPFLVYADGDGNTCGGLSIVQLDGNDITRTVGLVQKISIDGLAPALGGCDKQGFFSGSTTDPYIEGPQIHYISPADSGSTNGENYYLIFSVQPRNSRQVIAYATASAITGVYHYRGVIMAAGDSEFTNHASITKYLDRYIFAYHDGPGGAPNRKARAACLTFHQGKISPIYRTPDGFARCMEIKDTIALRSRGNGKVVVADPGGFGVSAANPNIGLWEKFDVFPRSNGRISLRAHANGKFVTANDSLGGLRANADDVGGAAEFALQFNANGSVSLGHPWGGFVAPTTSTGSLINDNTPRAPTVGPEFDIVPLNGGFFGLRTAFEEQRLVTAPNGIQAPLVASGGSGTSVAWEERFTFDFETSGEGRARLRWTAPDRFVSADLNRSGDHPPLIADRAVPLDWETFTLLWNADGTFSLKAVANNKFVAAPPTWFGGSLVADRDAIGTWEKFDLVSAGSGVVW